MICSCIVEKIFFFVKTSLPVFEKDTLFCVGYEEKIIPIVISSMQSMVCELLKTKINQLSNKNVAFFANFHVFLLSKSLTQNDYKCNIYNTNKNRVEKEI